MTEDRILAVDRPLGKLDPEFHSSTEYTLWAGEQTGTRFLAGIAASASLEELYGITWGLWGAELDPWQAAQRLYRAGFTDAKTLATFWAVLEAESGGFLKAWHHNVERELDGSIKRDAEGRMTVKSTDLGFIQRNVLHSPAIRLRVEAEASAKFVEALFAELPELARGDESAAIAFQMFQSRGFQPWYAYTNGSYKRSLERGCLAVANFLGKVLLRDDRLFTRRVA